MWFFDDRRLQESLSPEVRAQVCLEKFRRFEPEARKRHWNLKFELTHENRPDLALNPSSSEFHAATRGSALLCAINHPPHDEQIVRNFAARLRRLGNSYGATDIYKGNPYIAELNDPNLLGIAPEDFRPTFCLGLIFTQYEPGHIFRG